MTSPWDLCQSERTVLQAIGLVMEDMARAPTTTDARDRFNRLPPYGESSHPVFYNGLRRLEQVGYITKAPSPEDARLSIVGLTADGERALEAYAQRATAACGIKGVNL